MRRATTGEAGAAIGILMLDARFERFPGDIGNPRTWPFPVRYRIVAGATPSRVVATTDDGLLAPFKAAADALVADGVEGITTTCGFLSLYQQELAAHCAVPVATSALLQVAMVARILPRGRRPGIITFSARELTRAHLERAGADPATPVAGMPEGSAFQRAIRDGDTSVPCATLRAEALDVAEGLVRRDPTIGAIVCECTNLSPHAAEIRARLGVPVFDMLTLVHWFQRGLRPERFPAA